MVRLLHLSDLHFGAHSRLAGRDHAKLLDFARIEPNSAGCVAGRALLAANRSDKAPPIAQLLAPACRLPNASAGADSSELEAAVDRHGPELHPLWTSLARHLARRATDDDCALLESLARDPNQVEDGPLRWGLRFIVRGDVMLPDGSFVTLDELCDDAGLPHLPYLEDPPEPLDIDWEDEAGSSSLPGPSTSRLWVSTMLIAAMPCN